MSSKPQKKKPSKTIPGSGGSGSGWFITSVSLLGLVVFGLVVAIVVLLFFTFRTDPPGNLPLPGNVQFPMVYPIIEQQIHSGDDRQSCFNMVQETGNKKNFTNKLRVCSSNIDCTSCPLDQRGTPVTCQQADKNIRDQQSNLYGNDAPKYCLPVLQKCMPDRQCDFSKMKQCTLDSDCAFCNDDVGNAARMTCVSLNEGETMTYVDQDGTPHHCAESEGTVGVCLPEKSYCNTKNGTPTWVADADGTSQHWKCECTNPDIYGGETCDVLLACNNSRVTAESKQYQKLYLNVGEGASSDTPIPWDTDSGIPANVMRCTNSPETSCTTATEATDCGPNGGPCVSSTVCRCDGIDVLSGGTFRDDPSDLNTCLVDPCYTYVTKGGRMDDTSTSCICSGAGRSLWDIDKHSTGIPEYRGSCQDRTKSNVTFPSSTNCLDKGIPPNSAPQITGLVSVDMKDPKDTTGPPQPRCILDPCQGISGDPSYPPGLEAGNGNWNHETQKCDCITTNGYYSMNIDRHNEQQPETPFATNPLGHMCYNVFSNTARLACGPPPNAILPSPCAPLGFTCECADGYVRTKNGTACVPCLNSGDVDSCAAGPCCPNHCWECYHSAIAVTYECSATKPGNSCVPST